MQMLRLMSRVTIENKLMLWFIKYMSGKNIWLDEREYIDMVWECFIEGEAEKIPNAWSVENLERKRIQLIRSKKEGKEL